jgi:hypothetical protein
MKTQEMAAGTTRAWQRRSERTQMLQYFCQIVTVRRFREQNEEKTNEHLR